MNIIEVEDFSYSRLYSHLSYSEMNRDAKLDMNVVIINCEPSALWVWVAEDLKNRVGNNTRNFTRHQVRFHEFTLAENVW